MWQEITYSLHKLHVILCHYKQITWIDSICWRNLSSKQFSYDVILVISLGFEYLGLVLLWKVCWFSEQKQDLSSTKNNQTEHSLRTNHKITMNSNSAVNNVLGVFGVCFFICKIAFWIRNDLTNTTHGFAVTYGHF